MSDTPQTAADAALESIKAKAAAASQATQQTPASLPPPPTPPVVAAAPQPELTRQQKLAALCETQFLRIEEMIGATFSHRGFCAKCGWQSMQHSKEDAFRMTSQHVMSHWKDVTGML